MERLESCGFRGRSLHILFNLASLPYSVSGHLVIINTNLLKLTDSVEQ